MNVQRDWEKFALLIVDVQQDFWSNRISKKFSNFSVNISKLLNLCRSEGLEIIHIRAKFMPDKSDWIPKFKLREKIPCIQGTSGSKTLPFALDHPGETVFYKQSFDGFHNKDLLRYLREKDKQFLLTAGLITSVCVLFTTVSAAQLGFPTAIIEDCCADEPLAHEQTLNRYDFIFERTTLDFITDRHREWIKDIQ